MDLCRSHICLDNSVSAEYLSCLNDFKWFEFLSLNSPSQSPIYFSVEFWAVTFRLLRLFSFHYRLDHRHVEKFVGYWNFCSNLRCQSGSFWLFTILHTKLKNPCFSTSSKVNWSCLRIVMNYFKYWKFGYWDYFLLESWINGDWKRVKKSDVLRF